MKASSDRPVRVRMAPSPTGPLHVGTARTALYNWLFARKNNGKFILRIEDTDKERSEKKYEDEIVEGFAWLGINSDEGPYRQSERTDIYEKYLKELLAKGEAYYCYCTKEELEAQRQGMLAQGLPPKYSGRCRNLKEAPAGKKPEVIRFKIQEVKVEFKDIIRGKVIFDATLLGDQAIAKDLRTPLYNFAVVVDDELMEISHVIRGEDHLSNTPKQILMQRALGFHEPIYAHIPLLLNADRSKMSKRLSDVALSDYREKGYLPEALMNFLALLGWHPTDNKEVMSREELINAFELERVQKAGAIFSEEKLAWINKEYLKQLGPEKIAALLMPRLHGLNINVAHDTPPTDAFVARLVEAEQSRASTLNDFIEMGRFFFELPDYDPALVPWKGLSPEDTMKTLNECIETIKEIGTENPSKEMVTTAIGKVVAAHGNNRGEVLWPLRVALSGQQSSPDPVEIIYVLGKAESIRRIEAAIQKMLK